MLNFVCLAGSVDAYSCPSPTYHLRGEGSVQEKSESCELFYWTIYVNLLHQVNMKAHSLNVPFEFWTRMVTEPFSTRKICVGFGIVEVLNQVSYLCVFEPVSV